MKPGKIIFILLLSIFSLGLIRWGAGVSDAVLRAVMLCGSVLLPALFPFFIVSRLVLATGMGDALSRCVTPLTQHIFHLPGICASPMILGAIGGYPIGAKNASALYQEGYLSREDASALICCCNNAGPAFLCGAVGSGLLESAKAGLLLYAVHLASALLCGCLFRRKKYAVKGSSFAAKNERIPILGTFLSAVSDGLMSFLNVCAFVIFFAVLTAMLEMLPILKERPSFALLCGFLEMTSGISRLAEAGLPAQILLPSISFLAGWGGISVQCQSVFFLQQVELPIRRYLKSKMLQGLFAALLTQLLLLFRSPAIPSVRAMLLPIFLALGIVIFCLPGKKKSAIIRKETRKKGDPAHAFQ